VVAAGSVVLCEGVPTVADACGVAIRVAMASQFASQAATPFGSILSRDRRWHLRLAFHHVLEVVVTPLRDYLERGRGGGFAVYRLRDEFTGHIPATLQCCRTYLGRPYDIRYRLDDEKIYCSELIYEAFRDATEGQELGSLSRFGDMDWGAYEVLIRQIEGGPVPVDRMMITPVGLARAPQLVPVYWHNLAIEAR